MWPSILFTKFFSLFKIIVNLIAKFHVRYGKKGGIAYHHVADNYIALFSTFIPCGVWEAVAIIQGLLQNKYGG